MLSDTVAAVEACAGDKEGVLEVDLILLIVGLVCELNEAVNGELSVLCGIVCDLCPPDLIGLTVGNIVGGLGLYLSVLSGDNCISRTVAALGLVLVKGLADRLP